MILHVSNGHPRKRVGAAGMLTSIVISDVGEVISSAVVRLANCRGCWVRRDANDIDPK